MDRKITLSMGVILAIIFTLAGCQGKLGNARGKFVAVEKRLDLPQEGSASGSWQGKTDLVIEYTVTTSSGVLQIAGDIVFSRPKLLNSFQCSLVLIDGDGSTLTVAGIASGGGRQETQRIPFGHEMQLPPAARFFAFSYNGTSSGRGSNSSPNPFWSSPW